MPRPTDLTPHAAAIAADYRAGLGAHAMVAKWQSAWRRLKAVLVAEGVELRSRRHKPGKLQGQVEALAADYRAGLSLEKLAAKHGVSTSGISAALRRAGVTLRPALHPRVLGLAVSLANETWSEAEKAELVRLWPTDASAAAIGRVLGKSKHSVINKAMRLRLPSRGRPIARRPRAEPAPAIAAEVIPFPRHREPAPPARIVASLPPTQCQWIGKYEGPFTDADKCGAPVHPDRPYCAEHCARAYQTKQDCAS